MHVGDHIPLTEAEQEVVQNTRQRLRVAKTLMLRGAREEQDAHEDLAKFINESHPELREWRGIISDDGTHLILVGPHETEASNG